MTEQMKPEPEENEDLWTTVAVACSLRESTDEFSRALNNLHKRGYALHSWQFCVEGIMVIVACKADLITFESTISRKNVVDLPRKSPVTASDDAQTDGENKGKKDAWIY